MDTRELLVIIGDLYLRNYTLSQELEKIKKESEELRRIIISLQGTNGTVST